jgi:hypothetical protein
MQQAEAGFLAAISSAVTAEAAWRALDDMAAAIAGHRLFTATVVDTVAGLVRRSYSNMPADYPTSGTKPLKGNTGDWYETVMVGRRTFVANTIEDIAKVFPDHALIASLGCGSVVNLPIVLEDRIVATINLLDATGHYTPERIAAIQAHLPIPARLCTALSLRLDPLDGAAA